VIAVIKGTLLTVLYLVVGMLFIAMLPLTLSFALMSGSGVFLLLFDYLEPVMFIIFVVLTFAMIKTETWGVWEVGFVTSLMVAFGAYELIVAIADLLGYFVLLAITVLTLVFMIGAIACAIGCGYKLYKE
jgi:hypothetical protein